MAALAYRRFRPIGGPTPRLLRGWSVLLLTAVGLVAITSGYSQLRYGDSRLVSGTYGAWPLYLANNVHDAPDTLFRTDDLPEELDPMIEYFRTTGWEERHAVFMGEVLDYWRAQPARALHGWLWRAQHFMGLHTKRVNIPKRLGRWGPRIHGYLVVTALALLILRLGQVWRTPGAGLGSVLSLGTVVAVMFVLYTAIHSLFPYSGFRYVAGSLTTVCAAVVFLVAEMAGTAPAAES